MSSTPTTDFVNVDNVIGTRFRNAVPITGSIYASNGNTYTKLAVGNDDDSLTADSTATKSSSMETLF